MIPYQKITIYIYIYIYIYIPNLVSFTKQESIDKEET